MHSIGDRVVVVARRLGKGEVDIEVTPTPLRLPPQRWGPFWSVFGHVVRNAVDHGLEGLDARKALGKPARGVVRMAFEERPDEVVFRFGDDGAGIDWDRLAEKASARGLPAATREDLEKALYADSVSTTDEATMTSGRGVGMGAVLSCVTAKGGSIEIESVRGQGTTWVFRLPKTMLIPEEVQVIPAPKT
jgi:two-component system chemotaxis sensor kinase CheA